MAKEPGEPQKEEDVQTWANKMVEDNRQIYETLPNEELKKIIEIAKEKINLAEERALQGKVIQDGGAFKMMSVGAVKMAEDILESRKEQK